MDMRNLLEFDPSWLDRGRRDNIIAIGSLPVLSTCGTRPPDQCQRVSDHPYPQAQFPDRLGCGSIFGHFAGKRLAIRSSKSRLRKIDAAART